jgi:asparaginyl-tRNA synthetase
MARVPLIRCIARLIGGAAAFDRASSVSFKFATGTALVRINDGSCVSDLQVVDQSNNFCLYNQSFADSSAPISK